MPLGAASTPSRSSGNGARSSRTKRETAAKGVEKKVEKKATKETRPKVLERLAKKVAVKAREVSRKEEKAETGLDSKAWKKGSRLFATIGLIATCMATTDVACRSTGSNSAA
ncbi:hypothetical protein LTR56_017969 [Elasticomyces elasticus]|nr:hypothetical protein LTR56_017969 [Elasticomyces elasticus]KAK3637170.1 hypothetical protein LTR22_018360 [Elasticomyces elasticus]KAK4914243.1 hypothetical protein LTR49_017486 [Elasticomyces elasticus]